MVTAVEEERAQRKAEIGIHHFAQINLDKKYQTNPIPEIKSTKSHTLNRLISAKISKANHDTLKTSPTCVLVSSNLVHIRRSAIDVLGRIGSIAHEKANNCKEASHSLWFNASIKLSIWFLNVFTHVSKSVIIIAIDSCHKPIRTQIQNTINAQSSTVIHGLHNLKLPAAWEIARSTKIAIKNTTGK